MWDGGKEKLLYIQLYRAKKLYKGLLTSVSACISESPSIVSLAGSQVA